MFLYLENAGAIKGWNVPKQAQEQENVESGNVYLGGLSTGFRTTQISAASINETSLLFVAQKTKHTVLYALFIIVIRDLFIILMLLLSQLFIDVLFLFLFFNLILSCNIRTLWKNI